jgi:hypothetical protein
MHNGVAVADQDAKLEIFHDFYLNLLGTDHPRTAALNFSAMGIAQLDLQEMEAPFTESEVKEAVFDLHPSKAPGPDGYTGCFYRHGVIAGR